MRKLSIYKYILIIRIINREPYPLAPKLPNKSNMNYLHFPILCHLLNQQVLLYLKSVVHIYCKKNENHIFRYLSVNNGMMQMSFCKDRSDTHWYCIDQLTNRSGSKANTCLIRVSTWNSARCCWNSKSIGNPSTPDNDILNILTGNSKK